MSFSLQKEMENKTFTKREWSTADSVCLTTVLAILLIWMHLTFNKLGICSEGWYSVYANMIMNGKTPYVDFELCFPPLYTYIITAINYVFGMTLLPLRIFGIVIYLSLAAVMYLSLRFIAPPTYSAIATLLAMFVMLSENTFIAYDYIRIYDLFNYLAAYFTLKAIVYATENKYGISNLLFGGLFCSLSILMRASSGVIVTVLFVMFVAVCYIFVESVKLTKKDVIQGLIGLAIPFIILFIWLWSNNVINEYFEMTLFSGVKGSFLDMLWNWIPRVFSDIILVPVFIISIVLLSKYWRKKDDVEKDGELKTSFFLIFSACVTSGIILLFTFNTCAEWAHMYWITFLPQLFVIDLSILIVFFVKSILQIRESKNVSKTDLAMLFLSVYIFGTCFGSGTSSGLSLGQSAFNYAFVTVLLLLSIKFLKNENQKKIATVAIVALVAFGICTSVSEKIITPYHWWGVCEDQYSEATCTTDIPYFDNIYLTPAEKEVYESFVDLYNSQPEDSTLYCYSQVMLFYSLVEHIPTVKVPVPWFDVARDKTVIEDLNYLKSNNPSMIVFADHGEYVLQSHERLFRGGDACGQRYMYDWLCHCRDDPSSGYIVAERYVLQNVPIYFLLKT